MIRESYYKVLESNSDFLTTPTASQINPSLDAINVTSELLEKWYTLFNKWYFDNKLPKSDKLDFYCDYFLGENFVAGATALVQVAPGHMIPRKITYNLSVPTYEKMFMDILLHEMIHILDYTHYSYHFSDKNYDVHGNFFLEQADKLNKYGWNITTTFDEKMEINKSSIFSGLLKRLKKYMSCCDEIASNTLDIFAKFLFNIASYAYCRELRVYYNGLRIIPKKIKLNNTSDLKVNIDKGTMIYDDLINMFKEQPLLTVRINSSVLTPELREIIFDIKEKIHIMNDKTILKKYGNVLKEEYKKIIQNTFNTANTVINDKLKSENTNKNGEVSEDIDEEDYDTMHHDIYDEAERLKKIAERSTYGDVKIIDDDTIEFTTE